MRKIVNPWKRIPEFKCFGCCTSNPDGLQMDFKEGDNGEIICKWEPQSKFDGWPGVIHGGIQCTLMDEVAAWVVQHDLKVSGVTSKLDTKFIKPVHSSEPYLIIKGKLEKSAHRLAWIECSIENMAGERCAEATAVYFTYSKEESVNSFYYNEMTFEDDTNENKE